MSILGNIECWRCFFHYLNNPAVVWKKDANINVGNIYFSGVDADIQDVMINLILNVGYIFIVE